MKKTRWASGILNFSLSHFSFFLQDESRERVKAQTQDLCSQQTNKSRELQKGGETPFTNANKHFSLLNVRWSSLNLLF